MAGSVSLLLHRVTPQGERLQRARITSKRKGMVIVAPVILDGG
jgi:hypothetical protein